MWCTLSLPLLPCPLLPGEKVSVMIPSIGLIDVFENHSYLMGPSENKNLFRKNKIKMQISTPFSPLKIVSLPGVMDKVLDYCSDVSKFEHQSLYYVHFRTWEIYGSSYQPQIWVK